MNATTQITCIIMSETKLNNSVIHLPIDSFEAYLQRVHQIPMLTEEEEKLLGKRYQQDNNLNAAQTLVTAHLRYVVRVARGYAGYGLQLSDLVQEGTIGLMKAVKRFNPDRGVRLVSFAVHWIKAEVHEFIIRNWRIVKIATTKAQRKLFFNLRSSKKRLGWFTQEEVKALAKDLGVKPSEVLQMEQRLNANDAVFDLPSNAQQERSLPSPREYLISPEQDPLLQLEYQDWRTCTKKKMHEALSKLDKRSKTVLTKRWLSIKKTPLQELAIFYNVSSERIRQLEKNAIQKIQKMVLILK